MTHRTSFASYRHRDLRHEASLPFYHLAVPMALVAAIAGLSRRYGSGGCHPGFARSHSAQDQRNLKEDVMVGLSSSLGHDRHPFVSRLHQSWHEARMVSKGATSSRRPGLQEVACHQAVRAWSEFWLSCMFT